MTRMQKRYIEKCGRQKRRQQIFRNMCYYIGMLIIIVSALVWVVAAISEPVPGSPIIVDMIRIAVCMVSMLVGMIGMVLKRISCR